jgi:hypothetical protein
MYVALFRSRVADNINPAPRDVLVYLIGYTQPYERASHMEKSAQLEVMRQQRLRSSDEVYYYERECEFIYKDHYYILSKDVGCHTYGTLQLTEIRQSLINIGTTDDGSGKRKLVYDCGISSAGAESIQTLNTKEFDNKYNLWIC